MSASRHRAPHLKSFVDSWVESGCLPGAIVGCWHRENETVVHASGVADVSTGELLTRDHLFRIYSMTKPITACALMLLVDDGMLTLDDPVSKYLPAFADARVCVGGTADAPLTEPAHTAITLRHLLTHTAGISYGIFSSSIPDEILKARVGPAAARCVCCPVCAAWQVPAARLLLCDVTASGSAPSRARSCAHT
jgi:CubicO group peptidase (beta-lactamase class C family)